MFPTIKEVMNKDFMENAKLLSGKSGADKEIHYVDIIEVPDIEGWIKEGGLYLTTGYSIKDDENSQVELVRYLVRQNAAGLCIKKGRYFDHIPEAIIECGRKNNFSIIELPKEVPYVDILTPIFSEVLDTQANILRKSAYIHKKLTEILLNGGGMDRLINTLYELVGRPVLIQNRKKEILALKCTEKIENIIKDSLDFSEEEVLNKFETQQNPIRIELKNKPYQRVIAPILVSRELFGYVSIFEKKNSKLNRLDIRTVEHASSIIALDILKHREKLETQKRLKANLIEDILNEEYNSSKTILSRAHYLGWDLNKDYVALLIDIDNFEEYFLKTDKTEIHFQNIKREITRICNNVLDKYNKKRVMVNRSDSILIFYNIVNSEDQEDLINTSKEIKNEIDDNFSQISVSIGIGNFYPGLDGLKESYREAREALEIGRKIFEGNRLFHIDQLEIYKLIHKVEDEGYLYKYYKKYIGPLIKYDKNYSSNLVKTIRVFIKNSGNKANTARELCIHRNTLNYRLSRIEDIVKLNLKDAEICFKIYMALKVYNLLED